jgi:hypothetical protein
MGRVDIGVAQERADVRMWDIKDNKLVVTVCPRDPLARLIEAHRSPGSGQHGRQAAREPPLSRSVARELVVKPADRADGWFLLTVQHEQAQQ